MLATIKIVIDERFYNKDPHSSELGRNIISNGIQLMDELGYEAFTFKKLAIKINSTEASVYRYFQNKFKFLVYLSTWYWAWIEHIIDYQTHHMEDNTEKLSEIIKIICHADDSIELIETPDVDITILRRIVREESDKTYLTKKVDEINSKGLFIGIKGLCHRVATIINRINPNYKYSHALVSTILEASHQQMFFSLHLPSLTEFSESNTEKVELQIFNFLNESVKKLIS